MGTVNTEESNKPLWQRAHNSGRVECRECALVCERVVSPWRCLKAGYSCVYAFTEQERVYFGCLHKVFSPELDMEAFGEAGQGATGRVDPYGPLRVARAPRPQCPVSVERAYHSADGSAVCVNVEFLRAAFTV